MAERRRKFKKEQIMEIRTTMAQKLFDENKIGKMDNCSPTKSKAD